MAGGAIMISDEELKAISQVDVKEIVKNYCKVFTVPQEEAENAMGPMLRSQEMAAELLQLREEKRDNLQCWLADDTERGAFDEQEIAEDIADNLEDGGSTIEKILCSTRLPARHMRVWLTGGEDREVHFEWVEKPSTPGL